MLFNFGKINRSVQQSLWVPALVRAKARTVLPMLHLHRFWTKFAKAGDNGARIHFAVSIIWWTKMEIREFYGIHCPEFSYG